MGDTKMDQAETDAARMKKLLDEFDSDTFLDEMGDFKYTNSDVTAVIHYDDMNYLGNASKNQLQEHSQTINGFNTEDIIELQNIKLVEDEPQTVMGDIRPHNPARPDPIPSGAQNGGCTNYPSLRQQPQNGGNISYPNNRQLPQNGGSTNYPSLRQQPQNGGNTSYPNNRQQPQNRGSTNNPNNRQKPQNRGNTNNPNIQQLPQNGGNTNNPNIQQLPQNGGNTNNQNSQQQPQNGGNTNNPNIQQLPQNGGNTNYPRNRYQQLQDREDTTHSRNNNHMYQPRSPGNSKQQFRQPLQPNYSQRPQGLPVNPHPTVPYWSPAEPPPPLPFVNSNHMFGQSPRPNPGIRYEHLSNRQVPQCQIRPQSFTPQSFHGGFGARAQSFTPQSFHGGFGARAQTYQSRSVPYK